MTSGPGVAGSLVVLAALAAPAAAQQTAARTASITYLTTVTAYLDAGRLDGLRDSARVDVVRGGRTIGELRVAFLASHQAACAIVTASLPLAVGDTAQFVPVPPSGDSSAAVAAPGPLPRPAPPRQPRVGLRGRVGLEYLTVGQLGGAAGFSQPALDLRVDGPPFGAPGTALTVDVRARRTYAILPDGSAVRDDRNRVYQASFAVGAPGARTRVTLGRQISGNLASIGVFDGVLGEVNGAGWSSGLFAGTEPDPIELAFSSSVTEFGAYVQRHNRPGADTRWSVTLGASDSYDNGQANREFAYLQGSYLGRRLSAFFTQEVDYYRSWKLMPGMDAISPTSTFAILQYRILGTLALNAGFDNRRNVRLYRDVVNPATAFDDAYRQGAWAGVSARLGGRYGVGVDVHSSGGGPAGQADAYTLSLSADRLTPLDLTVRERTTRYRGPQLTGWLHSLALSVDPTGRMHVELNGGVRQEFDPLTSSASTWATWVGADVDVTLARSWYVMFSVTRESGAFEGNDQLYGGLSYRF